MNQSEAKVRVRLDTKDAQASLKKVLTEAAKTSVAAGKRIYSAMGSAVSAVGLGVGIGAGIEAIRSPVASGFGTAFSEAAGAWGAQLENWALGDLAVDARASNRAREDTIAAFATIAGHTEKMPPEARAFYAQSKTIALEAEKGRKMFEMDEQFRGPGFEQIIDKALSVITQAISDGFRSLGNNILGFFIG